MNSLMKALHATISHDSLSKQMCNTQFHHVPERVPNIICQSLNFISWMIYMKEITALRELLHNLSMDFL